MKVYNNYVTYRYFANYHYCKIIDDFDYNLYTINDQKKHDINNCIYFNKNTFTYNCFNKINLKKFKNDLMLNYINVFIENMTINMMEINNVEIDEKNNIMRVCKLLTAKNIWDNQLETIILTNEFIMNKSNNDTKIINIKMSYGKSSIIIPTLLYYSLIKYKNVMIIVPDDLFQQLLITIQQCTSLFYNIHIIKFTSETFNYVYCNDYKYIT